MIYNVVLVKEVILEYSRIQTLEYCGIKAFSTQLKAEAYINDNLKNLDKGYQYILEYREID